MGELLDRIYGCLMGGAIGDAMAAPTEDWHYLDIREKFGRIARLVRTRKPVSSAPRAIWSR